MPLKCSEASAVTTQMCFRISCWQWCQSQLQVNPLLVDILYPKQKVVGHNRELLTTFTSEKLVYIVICPFPKFPGLNKKTHYFLQSYYNNTKEILKSKINEMVEMALQFS